MSSLKWPDECLPVDGSLRDLVLRTTECVARVAPLSVLVLGGTAAPLDAQVEPHGQGVAELAEIAADLDVLQALDDTTDEVDRRALGVGLRRAVAAADRSAPAAPAALERHLQFALLRLLRDPGGGLLQLAELVESAPRFLLASRPELGAEGASGDAGRLAVDAAGRLPALLDAVAGAAAALAPTALRFRVEAALGALLQAGAEESGWLLKEFLPAALDISVRVPDTLSLGLGFDLHQLERLAEAALTDSVLADGPAGDPIEPFSGLAAATEGWARVAGPSAEVAVAPVPAWLAALMPTVSLSLPPLLDHGVPQLLVGEGVITDADLHLLHRVEYLPWAVQRPRAARLILPSPDLAEGWRAHVRAQAPGGELPWPRELAWRSALGLAAVSMLTRKVTVDEAAALVATESGIPEATARTQCMTVRRNPLAALTFLAGRAQVVAALASVGEEELLAAGPLPAALVGAHGAAQG